MLAAKPRPPKGFKNLSEVCLNSYLKSDRNKRYSGLELLKFHHLLPSMY